MNLPELSKKVMAKIQDGSIEDISLGLLIIELISLIEELHPEE